MMFWYFVFNMNYIPLRTPLYHKAGYLVSSDSISPFYWTELQFNKRNWPASFLKMGIRQDDPNAMRRKSNPRSIIRANIAHSGRHFMGLSFSGRKHCMIWVQSPWWKATKTAILTVLKGPVMDERSVSAMSWSSASLIRSVSCSPPYLPGLPSQHSSQSCSTGIIRSFRANSHTFSNEKPFFSDG